MAPNTAKDWITVADERAADAEAMLSSREDSIGPVYMIGCAIECSLKAYLRSCNTPFARSGSAEHNLKKLWRACGFRLNQLQDRKGHQKFFIQSWDSALRYERLPPKGFSSSELVKGGKRLAEWIRKQIGQKRREEDDEQTEIRAAIRENLQAAKWLVEELWVERDPFIGWLIVVVSSGFEGLSQEERKKIALAGLDDVDIEWLELLTPNECEWAGMLPWDLELKDIPLWPEALARGKQIQSKPQSIFFPSELEQALERPLIVTFYSWRGGIGRSTALAYTAKILAARGRKVVCIDMNLEVPGLATLFGKEEDMCEGYDLLHLFLALEKGEKADISQYLLRLDDSTDLYCLPLNISDANYTRLLGFIGIEAWYRGERNPLHLLMDLLQNGLSFTPDVILFDASSGLTPYSSPLLFDLSDLVIMTYFPNPQAMTAMPPVVQALLAAKTKRELEEQVLTPELRFLLSPIPASKLSQYKQQALENIAEWLSILKEQDNAALVCSDITHLVPYREVIAASDFILSDQRAKIEVWGDYEAVAEWIEDLIEPRAG